MKCYLNSCVIQEVREAMSWGILDGITMNPLMLSKLKSDYVQALSNICKTADVPDVLAQVASTDHETIVREAKALSAIDPKIVVKIPACLEGYKAMQALRKTKIRICVTCVHSVYEAILGEKMGAYIVAVFTAHVARWENYHELLSNIRQAFDRARSQTLLLSCVHDNEQFVGSAVAGADMVTMDLEPYKALFYHPLSEIYWKSFSSSWKESYGEKNWITGWRE
jgi:transaldolase